jgi:single-stranded-DNA-specific exonuclease
MTASSLQGMKAVWEIEEPIPGDLRDALGGQSVMLSHLLYCRGYRTADEILAFFSGELVSHDPFLLPDMEAAVERIARAVDGAERVAVYGDFDCDGITSAAVLVQVLGALGLDPIATIPTRVDGHGLHPEALASLADQGVSLIVTADCGVTAIEEVRVAAGMGMDVIVTDHHEVRPDGSLPPCLVVAPTRLDSVYPCRFLCGVGLAYKLAQALSRRLPGALNPDEVLDLVALGTIADIVPLRDENRSLVVRGLRRLQETRRPGLRALYSVSGVSADAVDPVVVSYYLAPRINAANRMASPQIAYDLLTATDDRVAEALAQELSDHNQRRQVLVAQHLEEIAEQIGAPAEVVEEIRAGRRPPMLMIVGDWPAGISGLLASKLVDVYGLPAFVGTDGGSEIVSVSARSIPGVRVDQILEQCEAALPGGIFLGYGGHAGAGGFSVDRTRLSEALGLLETRVSMDVPIDEVGAVLMVDAEVTLAALTLRAARQVKSLAPFGVGFTEPLFLTRDVTVKSVRRLSGKHARFRLEQAGVYRDAVWFNAPDEVLNARIDSHVDAVFHLDVDEWRGAKPQLRLRDWRPAL